MMCGVKNHFTSSISCCQGDRRQHFTVLNHLGPAKSNVSEKDLIRRKLVDELQSESAVVLDPT